MSNKILSVVGNTAKNVAMGTTNMILATLALNAVETFIIEPIAEKRKINKEVNKRYEKELEHERKKQALLKAAEESD